MTKKEQARFDMAVRELRIEVAFSWPKFEKPVPLALPVEFGEVVQGWDFNAYSGEVHQAWTQSGSSGHGLFTEKSGSSRGSRDIYPSRLNALKALRWAVCERFARDLAYLDCKIVAERKPDLEAIEGYPEEIA